MKYIIDVGKDRVSKHGKLELLCEVENSLPQYIHTAIDARPYTEPDRKDIEDEVWEFLDFLFTGMNSEERYECFNKVFSHQIVSTMSYQEAKAKYEAWLKQKDEIKVGDEVTLTNGRTTSVVIGFCCGSVNLLYKNGDVGQYPKDGCQKTGRHFDEVAELLEKMRGEEQWV